MKLRHKFNWVFIGANTFLNSFAFAAQVNVGVDGADYVYTVDDEDPEFRLTPGIFGGTGEVKGKYLVFENNSTTHTLYGPNLFIPEGGIIEAKMSFFARLTPNPNCSLQAVFYQSPARLEGIELVANGQILESQSMEITRNNSSFIFDGNRFKYKNDIFSKTTDFFIKTIGGSLTGNEPKILEWRTSPHRIDAPMTIETRISKLYQPVCRNPGKGDGNSFVGKAEIWINQIVISYTHR